MKAITWSFLYPVDCSIPQSADAIVTSISAFPSPGDAKSLSSPRTLTPSFDCKVRVLFLNGFTSTDLNHGTQTRSPWWITGSSGIKIHSIKEGAIFRFSVTSQVRNRRVSWKRKNWVICMICNWVYRTIYKVEVRFWVICKQNLTVMELKNKTEYHDKFHIMKWKTFSRSTGYTMNCPTWFIVINLPDGMKGEIITLGPSNYG